MSAESLLGLSYRIAPSLSRVIDEEERPNGRIVRLRLLHSTGHFVEFEDVGTGVSQLIPVLVALHGTSSVIHQPELHLHPRVQSSLGDVLVERLAQPWWRETIVESHSEHLLLRILRRIRESGHDLVSGRHPVSPEDISVLYFDPQEDGSTSIRSLRVNAHGEFIDPWPHGFFEERYDDLRDV